MLNIELDKACDKERMRSSLDVERWPRQSLRQTIRNFFPRTLNTLIPHQPSTINHSPPPRSPRIAAVKPFPLAIKQLLMEGRLRCPADQPIFANPAGRKAISARRIQILIREAAKRAGLPNIVLPVTLRHSYAVHFLHDGGTIRQLQDNLDHLLLETTTRYLDITGRQETVPPEPPQRSTPVLPTFWQEITDRFTRKIKGIRLFMSSA